MADIQRADPHARRAAIAIVVAGTLAGAVLIAVADASRDDVIRWIERDRDTRVRATLAVMMLLTAGPALGMAAYLWQLGRRAVGAGRYPPPGLRVMRDTPVLTGTPARQRGRVIQGLAALLAISALLLAWFVWRLSLLLQTPVP